MQTAGERAEMLPSVGDDEPKESNAMERKLLQIAIALAGLAAVGFGLAGVLFGTTIMDMSDDILTDSHVRFLKGMTLAIGFVYWSAIPDIERHSERISLVTFILVGGAVARLMAVVSHGVPTMGLLVSLVGGLIFVPLLWVWQRHVASVASRTAIT
jgi:hypothetical protein